MSKGEIEVEQPTPAERTLGRRTAESRATVPDIEYGVEVDMRASLALARARGVTNTAVLLRACALALREVPRANAAYRDGRFELYSRINVGVVMEGASGPATPTVLDADTKPAETLDDELASVAERARTGALTAPELSSATFTLHDLGPLGIDRPAIVIAGGQAAALAAGSIREVPVVRDGAIVPGQNMQLTLAADHRILYGALAARFLTRIRTLLEDGIP